MKATIIFELPEENEDFRNHLDGPEWKFAMFDLNEWLRSEVKYGEKEEYAPVRDMLYEILADRNLSLEIY